MSLRSIVRDPAQFGFVIFTAAIIIQVLHELEHFLQVIQKHVWHLEEHPGLLGYWFDMEWVHFLYNGSLWLGLLAVWIAYRKNPGMWRPSTVAATALTFAMIFQGFHFIEHSVRIVQYYQGDLHPPGILGLIAPIIELHFWLNSVVTTAMVIAYALFRPWLAVGIKFRFAI